jgi:hypothetical protein
MREYGKWLPIQELNEYEEPVVFTTQACPSIYQVGFKYQKAGPVRGTTIDIFIDDDDWNIHPHPTHFMYIPDIPKEEFTWYETNTKIEETK